MDMDPLTSTEELTDALASIELERQERAREAGNATACAEALRRLQALQANEKQALQSQGPSDIHSANLATLTTEIARVQKLAGTTNRAPRGNPQGQGQGQRHEERGGGGGGGGPPRGAPRPQPRNRGRRTGSRGGGH
jgi:hypothetical protein